MAIKYGLDKNDELAYTVRTIDVARKKYEALKLEAGSRNNGFVRSSVRIPFTFTDWRNNAANKRESQRTRIYRIINSRLIDGVKTVDQPKPNTLGYQCVDLQRSYLILCLNAHLKPVV